MSKQKLGPGTYTCEGGPFHGLTVTLTGREQGVWLESGVRTLDGDKPDRRATYRRDPKRRGVFVYVPEVTTS